MEYILGVKLDGIEQRLSLIEAKLDAFLKSFIEEVEEEEKKKEAKK